MRSVPLHLRQDRQPPPACVSEIGGSGRRRARELGRLKRDERRKKYREGGSVLRRRPHPGAPQPPCAPSGLTEKASRPSDFDWPELAVRARPRLDEELRELDEVIAAGRPGRVEHGAGTCLFALPTWRASSRPPRGACARRNRRFEDALPRRRVRGLKAARPSRSAPPALEQMDARVGRGQARGELCRSREHLPRPSVVRPRARRPGRGAPAPLLDGSPRRCAGRKVQGRAGDGAVHLRRGGDLLRPGQRPGRRPRARAPPAARGRGRVAWALREAGPPPPRPGEDAEGRYSCAFRDPRRPRVGPTALLTKRSSPGRLNDCPQAL